MTLTKARIVEEIQEQLGLSKTASVEIFETILEIMKRTMESGEDVLISGFGKFCVNSKESRRGRNPATGQDLQLSARRVVTFKCATPLRKRMNHKTKP